MTQNKRQPPSSNSDPAAKKPKTDSATSNEILNEIDRVNSYVTKFTEEVKDCIKKCDVTDKNRCLKLCADKVQNDFKSCKAIDCVNEISKEAERCKFCNQKISFKVPNGRLSFNTFVLCKLDQGICYETSYEQKKLVPACLACYTIQNSIGPENLPRLLESLQTGIQDTVLFEIENNNPVFDKTYMDEIYEKLPNHLLQKWYWDNENINDNVVVKFEEIERHKELFYEFLKQHAQCFASKQNGCWNRGCKNSMYLIPTDPLKPLSIGNLTPILSIFYETANLFPDSRSFKEYLLQYKNKQLDIPPANPEAIPSCVKSWINFELVEIKKRNIARDIITLENDVKTFLEQKSNENIKYEGDAIITTPQLINNRQIQVVNFDQFSKFINLGMNSNTSTSEEKQLCQYLIKNWTSVFPDCTPRFNTELYLQSAVKCFGSTPNSASTEFVELRFRYKPPKQEMRESTAYQSIPESIKEWISKQLQFQELEKCINQSQLWNKAKEYLKSQIESWIVENKYCNKVIETSFGDIYNSTVLEEPCLKMITTSAMHRQLLEYLLNIKLKDRGPKPKIATNMESITTAGVKLRTFDTLFKEFAEKYGQTKYSA